MLRADYDDKWIILTLSHCRTWDNGISGMERSRIQLPVVKLPAVEFLGQRDLKAMFTSERAHE